MTRILHSCSLAEANTGDTVEIRDEELHYLRRVRRHQIGDKVYLQDADGIVFQAVVTDIQKRSASLTLSVQQDAATEPTAVHILSAVPKGKVLDDVIRQMNELGVAKYTPLICERSSVDPGDGRVDRWRRIAGQSVRQCRRSRPLEVASPVLFADAMAIEAAQRFILHPSDGASAGEMMTRRDNRPVAMLVGPEGGFTDAEVSVAVANGFQAMTLGQTILRIETALIVASVTCVTLLGGFD